MIIDIIRIEEHNKGKFFTFSIGNEKRRILFLFHALNRIKKWDSTPETVAKAMLLPDEVILGHRNRYIAHKRYDHHLIRAVYEYEEMLPVLVTVYFPFADRYFRGGNIYEDKIF